MSLREQLKRAVGGQLHVASPKGCNSATPHLATQLDPQPARNAVTAVTVLRALDGATGGATDAQQAGCTDGEWLGQALHKVADPDVVWLRSFGAEHDDAERLAGWIRARDLDADDRRLCVECWHFADRGRYCRHPRRSALRSPRDLGDLALMPQRCSGFTASKARGCHAK